MSNKRYYWLKQKADFFKDAKIKKLRRIAGGDTYTIIYQKMMLLSITNGGVIPYQGIEPSFHEELALELDEDEVNVQATLVYLASQGMMEQIDDNEYLMSQVPALIGSESSSAERVRKLRAKKYQESLIGTNVDHKALQCNSTVTQRKRKEKREKSIDLTIPLQIAKHLEDSILVFKPNFNRPKSLEGWATDIEKAIRIDGRTKEELTECIDWIFTTFKGEFWRANIQSGKKLREKFDTLQSQAMLAQQKQGNDLKWGGKY